MTLQTIETSHSALARFGHALSDSTRVQILVLLSKGPHHPADMADIIQVTRQSISNHLSCLKGCGLAIQESVGRRTSYRLADPRIKHALQDLQEVVLDIDPIFCENLSNEDHN